MVKETLKVFRKHLKKKGLNMTSQRKLIIETFLNNEKHFSLDELYELVSSKEPSVGRSTVYRTLKLMSEAGIASPVEFGDRITRYEHAYGHEHHDHLICLGCGAYREIKDDKIENIQTEVAEKNGYSLIRHSMKLFGLCPKCRRKEINND